MARPAIKPITNNELTARIKAGERQINVGGVAGLMLRVSDAEAMAGIWLLVSQGKPRFKKSLGAYGKPPMGITLAAARAKAAAILAEAKRTGVSPVEKERQEREAAQAAEAEAKRRAAMPTLNEVFNQWLEENGRKPKYTAYRRHTDESIYGHIAPIIGAKPVDSISVDDLVAVCAEAAKPDKLKKADEGRSGEGGFLSGTTQRKIRGLMSALLDSAAAHGHIRVNLCLGAEYRTRLRGLTKPPKGSNNGALRPCEVPAFIRALCEYIATKDAALRSSMAARMLLFAVLTNIRGENARIARRTDIANGVWTIPACDMKVPENGAHVVFLSPEMLDLVAASPRLEGVDLIFPSATTGGKYTKGAFASVMRELNAARVGRDGKRWIDEQQTRDLGREIAATPHGIARASFQTWAVESAVDEETGRTFPALAVMAALHHAKDIGDGLGSAYNRAEFLELRRRLSAAWAKFCLSETPPELWAKVVRKP